MSRALEFSLDGTKKKPTQMYVHRQDFLLYSPFYDVYKDKCICLNAYFFGFRRSNNTPGRAHKLNTARIYLFIYFYVYLNETFFFSSY